MPFRPDTDFIRRIRMLTWAIAFGVSGLLLAGEARAQNTAVDSTPKESITTIRQFWGLTAEEKKHAYPFRFECDVTYYDPVWRNLWIQVANEGAYVAVGNRKLPIKSGQHITVTGTFE